MMEAFQVLSDTAKAFPTLLTLDNLFYAVIGLAVGIAWGAIPALSSTMAMALLIGFSAALEQHAAIIFLLAIYSGSVYGGSISAICTNIPGTPAAACTALDGYPLFRNGKGGRALGISIAASTIGNLFGALILILFTPVLLKLVLNVGAWEIALLGLWGVMISGSVTSQDSAAKGWLSGLIGLALSFVGVDAITGTPRFTYEIGFLYGGLNFVAILIGVFGFAEIARGLLMEKDADVPPLENRVTISMTTLVKNWVNILRSSSIGAIIGAIPAAGADIAAFISYSVSKRSASSSERELFGKGSYRGIIAAESANNSSVGGSLLPLLVLAIPGSTVAAAFMGAMNLQGIHMGPLIQISHPGLLEFIFASLITISILMGIIALAVGKVVIALLSVPRTVLLPCILPICVMGAFAAQNTVGDIYVMLIAGIAGIGLVAGGFPLAPIIMGVILGPLVDLNFRRAMIIFQDATFFDVLFRPIGLTLIVIILVTLVTGLWRQIKTS